MKVLSTSTKVLGALRSAGARKPTPTEALEQRVSFVYGSVKSDSSITREQIKKAIIEEKEGTSVE